VIHVQSQLGEIGPNVQPRVIQDHKTELGLTWKVVRVTNNAEYPFLTKKFAMNGYQNVPPRVTAEVSTLLKWIQCPVTNLLG
jgi:hypothetical protein